MALGNALSLIGLAAIGAFIVFAFRQGARVKPARDGAAGDSPLGTAFGSPPSLDPPGHDSGGGSHGHG